jgi:hypothetical protein
MADPLYYSLWFSNFRFDMLPEKLTQIMLQLPEPRVTAASVYPLSWQQTPSFQRIFSRNPAEGETPEVAVEETTEQLHEDSAYEFELPWSLWYPDSDGLLDAIWHDEPRAVRIVGYGPEFDEGAYAHDGHIRVDLGLDTPFLCEDIPLDEEGQFHVQQNVERLVELTASIEKHCGVETRLLWTESEESIAQKLIARMQKLN